MSVGTRIAAAPTPSGRLTPMERLEALCDEGSIAVLRSRVTSTRLGERAAAGGSAPLAGPPPGHGHGNGNGKDKGKPGDTTAAGSTTTAAATAVLPASINYRLDGTDVTGSSTITTTASGALITYQIPSPLALNSLHTNRVVFTNNAVTPLSFTNQWSFRIANLPVLLSTWATAPGSGTGPGFNDKIHWHQAGQDLIFRNSSIRAEDQVGGLLIDIDTGLPYVNDAAGPNGDGSGKTMPTPMTAGLPALMRFRSCAWSARGKGQG